MFVRAGHDVYPPEINGKPLDLTVRVPDSPLRYFDVTGKTIRQPKPTYPLLRKKHFAINRDWFVTLVVLWKGQITFFVILASQCIELQAPVS